MLVQCRGRILDILKARGSGCQSLVNLKRKDDVRATKHIEYRGAHLFFRYTRTVVFLRAVR